MRPGRPVRPGAAALAWLAVWVAACTDAPPALAPPDTLKTAAPPASGAPLQVASNDRVVPTVATPLRCDSASARVGSTVFCFDETARTYQQAEAHCQDIGGHLADIRSVDEAAAVRLAFGMPFALPPTMWIGLVEPFRTGEWRWMSNTRTTYENWEDGEPNDAGGGEDCGERISRNGKWNDVDCAAARGFICEGPAIVAGAKSSFKCTGIGVQAGDIPYCAYVDRALGAAQAEAFCKTTGGHLAELSTAEKDKALRVTLGPRTGTGNHLWLGLSDERSEGDFRNPEGESHAFRAWRAGEPNNAGSNEDCVTWGPEDGLWNDAPCSFVTQSLCRGVAEPVQALCDGPLPFVRSGCTDVAHAAGVRASASQTWEKNGAERAIDGDCKTSWNAGGAPVHNWQVDLGSVRSIRGVTLAPNMTPATAKVAHDVAVSTDGQVFRAVVHFDGTMTHGRVYPLDFESEVSARWVRVTTTASPSWVSWQEVGVFDCP